ncbi:hypothetical protein PR003_g13918 [Phytophthora rubi]|uniref:Uncharacterized protein n=1 Tax=Phytophthora rubi TaxID=129364 RepID=A0A6A4F5H6_9STRA|nr:hypothetical protein PR003_g13918 [Phytophthora rubi]
MASIGCTALPSAALDTAGSSRVGGPALPEAEDALQTPTRSSSGKGGRRLSRHSALVPGKSNDQLERPMRHLSTSTQWPNDPPTLWHRFQRHP